MTLALRRKRQITVPNTPPGTVPEHAAAHPLSKPLRKLIVLLLIAISMSLGTDRAVAKSSSADRPQQKLQWLPYRPSKPRVVRRTAKAKAKPKVDYAVRVVSATDEQPSAAAEQTAAAVEQTAGQSGTNPFNDPFGDGDGRNASASRKGYPSLAQQAIARKQAPAEPIPMEPDIDPPEVLPSDAESDIELPDAELTVEPPVEDEGYELDDDEDYSLPDELVREEPECPSPLDKEFFTPIGELTTDVSIRTDSDRDPADVILPQPCSLPEKTYDPNLRPSTWAQTNFAWKASGLCHKPLYFEDVHLERYGHSWGPYLQPVISGAHFFLTVPILPYKMGLNPPSECMYTLGYYRPGSCAPYLLDPIPLSIRAAFAQGGVSTGMAFLIP